MKRRILAVILVIVMVAGMVSLSSCNGSVQTLSDGVNGKSAYELAVERWI